MKTSTNLALTSQGTDAARKTSDAEEIEPRHDFATRLPQLPHKPHDVLHFANHGGTMRTRTAIATAVLLVASLTACGSSNNKPAAEASTSKPAATETGISKECADAVFDLMIDQVNGADTPDSRPDACASLTDEQWSQAVAEAGDKVLAAGGTPGNGGDDEAPAEAGFKVGEEARNRGTVVTIKKVREADAITLGGATKRAGADAKYVILETVIRNETKASMDLTCSYPIVNALIDDQDRRFDTIEDLSDIPGNPECNAQLQPGFKDEMKFVYRVPKDAKIVLWEFEEYDLEAEPAPSLVDLT
ncbi:hypothetical protein [Streptomyces sp. SYSU K217416]